MSAASARGAIDVHTHVVPERFPPYLGRHVDLPWPSMAAAHACHHDVMIRGQVYRTVKRSAFLLEDRLADMERMQVAMQCLSPMPELLSYWLPAEDAAVLCRHLNEYIAGMVAREPARFAGLGYVPLQDLDRALAELEHVVDVLGFPGVEIASHVNGVSIGDARFEPFFAAIERKSACVFVHALRPAGRERIVGAFSEQAVCFPADIALAATSIVTGGIAERHPALRICFSHGGGAFAGMLARLTRAWQVNRKARESLPRDPAEYARRFWYDSILFDPALLRYLVSRVGATQLVAGTDYPFTLDDPDPVATLSAIGTDAVALEGYLRGNALRWLGRT
jgi:aminocarboxymuconate-semialdehyde decarboxylase